MSPARPRLCPICRKPRVPEHAPFCSAACRDRDLVRWLDDGYAIPGPAASRSDNADEDQDG
jgi:endogenous inhibitor of DNA gyrase (YacG/DUF329 family)